MCHVSNSMQGFITIRSTNLNDQYLYMGNCVRAKIKAIGVFHLILDYGFKLDLSETLYVLSISRNLVYVSRLALDGFEIEFKNKCFGLLKNSISIGCGFLNDGLYQLILKRIFLKT